MKKRNVVILGSTGSIGKNCLEVIRANRDKFRVVGLSAHRNLREFEKQVKEFRPKAVAVTHLPAYMRLKKGLGGTRRILPGDEGVVEMVETLKADVVVSSIMGSAGLMPTLAAINKGIRVGIANKEPLVMAGHLMMNAAKKSGATIIPIDSEHSAVFQCLNGEPHKSVSRIILTASGGPFLHKPKADMARVTPEQALKHPRWKMGAKITVDSSTMMNKGLEVIEARWLFGMPPEKIEVVVHPQSIIHSMVEFEDTSVMAQLGLPDMKVPIAYALSYPERWPASLKRLNLAREGRLDFLPPDMKKFPCLKLSYRALEMGGTAPAVLNAANEKAVEMFMEGRIAFNKIPRFIERALDTVPVRKDTALKNILSAARLAEDAVNGMV